MKPEAVWEEIEKNDEEDEQEDLETEGGGTEEWE